MRLVVAAAFHAKGVKYGVTLKVATWNLDSTKTLTQTRRSSFLASMAAVDADIWVLTETWRDFVLPGYALASESMAASDLAPERRWTAIWTRSGLSGLTAAPEAVESAADRMACCRLEGLPLLIVGTVLPWTRDPRFTGKAGFCRAVSQQEREWARLKKVTGCELIIAGDFNQSIPHRSRFGSNEGEAALLEAFRSLGLTCVTQGKRIYSEKPRIDHIAVPSGCVTSSPAAWEIPVLGSRPITDHEGVAVAIE
jgi:hypothetical protein